MRTALQFAAFLQLAIALLNLALNRLMGWREDLERLPLLLREVHQVHAWFVSLTLAIFGLLTWKFATEMASGTNTVCCWLAGSIGVFWMFRTILQFAYYSGTHWRGRRGRTLIHIVLLVLYGGFALVYLSVAMQVPGR